MFLSKILTGITFLALLLVTFVHLKPAPEKALLKLTYERQLDTAQGLIDSHMRMDSRRRLDFFTTVGQDPKLVQLMRPLNKANASDGEAAAKKLSTYFKTKLFGSGGEKARAQFTKRFTVVELMDERGRVWARVGDNEDQGLGKDSMKGFPGVREALTRRVCSDNILDFGGKLWFIWACPVRYVADGKPVEMIGAVAGRKIIDTAYASSLLSLIGEQQAALDKLNKKKAKGKKARIHLAFFRSGRVIAQTTKHDLWKKSAGIYKKYKKQIEKPTIGRSAVEEFKVGASRHLMVVGRLPGAAQRGATYWAILWQFPKEEEKGLLEGSFPLIVGIAAALLALFFMFWEGDRPRNYLLRQARDLASGKIEHIEYGKLGGKMGSIARAVNEAVERVTDSAPRGPAVHSADLDSILGGPATTTADFSGPPPLDSSGPPPQPAPAPTASIFDSLGPPSTSSGGQGGPPPPPQGLPPPDPGSMLRSEEVSMGSLSTIPPIGTFDRDPDVAEYRALFESFLSTKRECGEPTEHLEFEAFANKLKKNKAAVIAKTGCSEVNFRVYVKEGKAALKATPVK